MDESLRRAEHEFDRSATAAAEAVVLQVRMRAGTLRPEHARAAAALGHPAARLLFPERGPELESTLVACDPAVIRVWLLDYVIQRLASPEVLERVTVDTRGRIQAFLDAILAAPGQSAHELLRRCVAPLIGAMRGMDTPLLDLDIHALMTALPNVLANLRAASMSQLGPHLIRAFVAIEDFVTRLDSPGSMNVALQALLLEPPKGAPEPSAS